MKFWKKFFKRKKNKGDNGVGAKSATAQQIRPGFNKYGERVGMSSKEFSRLISQRTEIQNPSPRGITKGLSKFSINECEAILEGAIDCLNIGQPQALEKALTLTQKFGKPVKFYSFRDKDDFPKVVLEFPSDHRYVFNDFQTGYGGGGPTNFANFLSQIDSFLSYYHITNMKPPLVYDFKYERISEGAIGAIDCLNIGQPQALEKALTLTQKFGKPVKFYSFRDKDDFPKVVLEFPGDHRYLFNDFQTGYGGGGPTNFANFLSQINSVLTYYDIKKMKPPCTYDFQSEESR